VTDGRGVRCAVISVPMNYADPNGAQIELTSAESPPPRSPGVISHPVDPVPTTLDYWARRVDQGPPEINATLHRVRGCSRAAAAGQHRAL